MKCLILGIALVACLWLGAGCASFIDPVRGNQIVENWRTDMHYITQDFDYIFAVGERSPLHRYTD